MDSDKDNKTLEGCISDSDFKEPGALRVSV
jgi:hypothetical protein